MFKSVIRTVSKYFLTTSLQLFLVFTSKSKGGSYTYAVSMQNTLTLAFLFTAVSCIFVKRRRVSMTLCHPPGVSLRSPSLLSFFLTFPPQVGDAVSLAN